MALRRKLIVLLSGLAGGYAMLSPTSVPGLGSIECDAPPYFEALTRGELRHDEDAGMNALRQQAGLALAQLQTRLDK